MLIEARHLFKSYDQNQEQTIIKDLSLQIDQGEFLAIMGPSGCGKSTLLNLLSTIDQPDSGEILYQGQAIQQMPASRLDQLRRREFGFVFQEATFLKHLNILDNICLPSLIGSSKKERQASYQKALELMEITGIKEVAQRQIHQVSGGQLQRAGICRALINQPQLIFADEPTGALNSQASQDAMKLMRHFHQQGSSVFLVTHDAHVASYAQKVLLIVDGQIQKEVLFEAKANLEERQDTLRAQLVALGI
ncbi:ABC transporter ATP-binding protein [Streptococcus oricebi]|uniref:ABC transporter ATP-binding protein n=1 Tax=Streptococcus oricebi TaxID=1547447 RepID=A0ABS5B1Q3_9STRE|nr:ABC transporter ATP-binding protein [Streptococcus oricebi]MBP2622763.1 ABC transporter ATP-binding protein [Streptococcus oricebi]